MLSDFSLINNYNIIFLFLDRNLTHLVALLSNPMSGGGGVVTFRWDAGVPAWRLL